MSEMMHSKSKYIKKNGQIKAMEVASVLYLFSLFVLPQYFGIPISLFDFTAVRVMILVMLFLILSDIEWKNRFLKIFNTKTFFVMLPYLFVTTYTMILRKDVGSLLNPFFEMIELLLLIYVIKDVLGVKKSFQIFLVFIFILTILGIEEYIASETPFNFLQTINTKRGGSFVRSGQYRIMSNCLHSIGYGLLLLTAFPFACIDFEKSEINLLKKFPLLLLIVTNVVLTGSRAALAFLIIEIVVLFLCSPKNTLKKNIIILFFIIMLFLGFLVVFKNTSIGRYFLLQITSVIDEVFGTGYSIKYGANYGLLQGSSDYRDQLIYVFGVSWLNPLVGMGRSYSFSAKINGVAIKSLDNFYVAEYVRYAYPGLITFILFLLYHIILLMKNARRSAICLCMGVCSICYVAMLYTVDSLNTLKYLYVLFAFGVTIDLELEKQVKNESKYLKRRL